MPLGPIHWVWQDALFLAPAILLYSPGIAVIGYLIACRPPISFWGRLRTGHWIIPGYDRCFLWPLAIFGLQWAWFGTAQSLSLPMFALVPTQTTLVSWCWFKSQAAFERFQFTGSHRIPLPFTVSSNSQGFTNT